ncbi:MAG: hypothetical protein MUC55_13055 [Burkholderiales bacterium]|nr:hypothetical protein [Burkholderiales bacterium]
MPAIQNPRALPTMPTTTFAMMPICALVFIMMLASQPTIPPMMIVPSHPIAYLLSEPG